MLINNNISSFFLGNKYIIVSSLNIHLFIKKSLIFQILGRITFLILKTKYITINDIKLYDFEIFSYLFYRYVLIMYNLISHKIQIMPTGMHVCT